MLRTTLMWKWGFSSENRRNRGHFLQKFRRGRFGAFRWILSLHSSSSYVSILVSMEETQCPDLWYRWICGRSIRSQSHLSLHLRSILYQIRTQMLVTFWCKHAKQSTFTSQPTRYENIGQFKLCLKNVFVRPILPKCSVSTTEDPKRSPKTLHNEIHFILCPLIQVKAWCMWNKCSCRLCM